MTGWFMGDVGFESSQVRLNARASGTMDLFVASYGPSGGLRWLRTAGAQGESYAEGRHVGERADGSLEVRGVFGGTVTFSGGTDNDEPLHAEDVDEEFVARFDSDGRLLALTRRARGR